MSDTAITTTTTVIVGEFPLNGRDLVRAELSTFNGRQVVGLRKWYRPEEGDPRPTSKGLTVAIHHLPKLAALASEALARARADGLIEPEGGEAEPPCQG